MRMNAVTQISMNFATAERALSPLGALLLVRVACDGGATRSEIATDLAVFLTHKLSPAEWRRTAETQIGLLIASGLATESRNRLKPSAIGASAAARYLGSKSGDSRDWAEVRDLDLIGRGLGITPGNPARLKMALRPDGLRALILQTVYGLPVKRNPSVSKLRAQLALVALDRAFGNTVKAGFGKGAAFTSKAGRTLAGQLSLQPRDFGTDQRLVVALAAEAVGAVQSDHDALKDAIHRNFGTKVLTAQNAVEPKVVAIAEVRALPKAANDAGPTQIAKPATVKPDHDTFVAAVKDAAALRAEGWPGNRKAFISDVWQAIRDKQSAWDITEIEFKCMLAEEHRIGRLVLATADLKDKRNLQALEASVIAYKNTVWHFLRVEDQ
jgi:hypothetical protein